MSHWDSTFHFVLYISRGRMAESCDNSIFKFCRIAILFSSATTLFNITINITQILHTLTSTYLWFVLSLVAILMEKAMAPHSSTLAWRISRTEEPGRLQSMGSLRVGHNWVTSHSLFTFMHWRRKWQPTPLFLPGESQGRGSLVGCGLWGRTESDTTEAT